MAKSSKVGKAAKAGRKPVAGKLTKGGSKPARGAKPAARTSSKAASAKVSKKSAVKPKGSAKAKSAKSKVAAAKAPARKPTPAKKGGLARSIGRLVGKLVGSKAALKPKKAAPGSRGAASPATKKNAGKGKSLAEKKSAAKSATTSVAVKLKSAPPVVAKKASPAAAARPAASKPAAAKPAPIPPAPVKKVVRLAPARPLSRPIPVGPPRTFTPVAAVPSSQWGPFREKLERKRQEILDMYARDLRSGQEASDDNTDDLVDRANNAISRELMFSLSDGERQLLLQVEDALTRMTSGAYGRCVHCGQPIAAPRLEALPWAKYCIDCQELQEKGLLEDA